MREKCPNTEFFWSVFSRIWTEYGDLLLKSPYSAQMWENTYQKKLHIGHFSHSEYNQYNLESGTVTKRKKQLSRGVLTLELQHYENDTWS